MSNAFGERPWFWEGRVQDAVAAHLTGEGWDVREMADTESKAPGIDLLATNDDRWLAIEVKGFPSTTYDHGPMRGQAKPTQPTNQARQWYSHALLAVMLLRDKRPDAEIAIALPRFPTYERLVARTSASFGLLGVGVYLLNESGAVDLAVAHRPVGDLPDVPERDSARPQVEGLVHGSSAARGSTCRAEVLAAFARLERRHGRTVFALSEIVDEVLAVTDRYAEQTIRTQVVSHMCVDAHGVASDDLERVGRGQYRVRGRA